MPTLKLAKDMLSLLHSDKRITKILNESNDYLAHHAKIREQIVDCNWIFRSLFNLMPETLETFWSGHIFLVASIHRQDVLNLGRQQLQRRGRQYSFPREPVAVTKVLGFRFLGK